MKPKNVTKQIKDGIKIGLLITSIVYGAETVKDYALTVEDINAVNKYSGEVYKPEMIEYKLNDFNRHSPLYKLVNFGEYLALKDNQK